MQIISQEELLLEKKILVIDDEEDIREIVVMMIEAEFDNTIVECANGREAIELLKKDPEISVILCDYNMPEANGGEVYTFLKENNKSTIPFCLLSTERLEDHQEFSSFKDDNPINSIIEKPFEHAELTEFVSSSLSSVASDSEEKELAAPQSEKTNYYRIKLERLATLKKTFADTYIKTSETKYIKLLNCGDSIEKEKLMSYSKKGVDILYLDKNQYEDFINNRCKDLQEKLMSTNLKSEEMMSLQLESIQQVQEVVKSIGVKQPVVELTEKVASSVSNELKKDQSIRKYFKMALSKKDYFYEHPNIVNYLCGAICKEMLWDDRVLAKFVFCSSFMDIGLEEARLVVITDIHGEKFNSLSSSEKQLVKRHMQLALDSVDDCGHVDSDVEKILLMHHEKPDGTGFPKGLRANQVPTTIAAFILAHNFAHQMIITGHPVTEDPQIIFDILGPSYKEGNFKGPYAALEKALSKD